MALPTKIEARSVAFIKNMYEFNRNMAPVNRLGKRIFVIPFAVCEQVVDLVAGPLKAIERVARLNIGLAKALLGDAEFRNRAFAEAILDLQAASGDLFSIFGCAITAPFKIFYQVITAAEHPFSSTDNLYRGSQKLS